MPRRPAHGDVLDRTTLRRAFSSLARHLAARGVRAHIYVAGSAPLVMAHRRSEATKDVDALAIEILPYREDPRPEVLFDSESLVVTGASPAHILAIKVRAARPRDLEDIKILARELGITTMAEVREIHRAAYPYDGIPVAAVGRVEACLAELRNARRGRAAPRPRPPRKAGYER